MKRAIVVGAVLLLGAVACSKSDKADTAAQNNPGSAGSATPAAAAPDTQIPTEQDFEEKAAQNVTAQNLDEQLDKLEKEIGQ